MASRQAVLTVILRSGHKIESPKFKRDKSEQMLADIGKARDEGESVSLPWLNVHGAEIEAVFLSERFG